VDRGHPEAWDYPLGRVADEAELIARRDNDRIATEAVMLQAAAGSIMSKEAGEVFQKLVGRLTGEG
jgi:hypothetical protein